MKRVTLFFTLVLLGMTQLTAQEYEYVPFVREGIKWVYRIQDYHYFEDYETNPARGDNAVYRTLELSGDTVINGKTYKAMHRYIDDEYSEPSDVIPIYLREENKKVYGIVPDGKLCDDALICTAPFGFPSTDEAYSGEEFLLYDFQDPATYWDNLINNDWLGLPLQLDTVEVGGHLAKRYYDERQDGDYFQVIEGIGATGMNSYPLGFLMPVTTGIHTTEYYSLEKVIEGDEVIYPQNYVEDRYMPLIREGVKWVNERVVVSNGVTTSYYYSYEFKGNHPELDSHNRAFKAVYVKSYNANGSSSGDETLVAGLREDEGCILSFRNQALNSVMDEGRNLINFYSYYSNDDVRLLFTRDNEYYIESQRTPTLNTDNLVSIEPIVIDGYRCSRLAYLNEQGDVVAYLIEGIGFDSYDMGDLLTPFTLKADPDADYQVWCGLSHVVKDGKIIYKGMRYRDDVLSGIDEVVTDKARRPMDDNYYNLMGQPVGQEVPTTPGIYIHQGKKICVGLMP